MTIVTPFLDTDPELLLATARTVLGQSFQQWEWVIVDDGSTAEESLRVLSRLSEVDARVRVVRHARNMGVPVARNMGIAHARGDVVLQLDGDDLLEPTAAEKWLWFLASYPEYSFVNAFHVGFGGQAYLWPRGFDEGEIFLSENLTNPAGLARRELFTAVGGFDETLVGGLEDWEFWLRCAAAGFWGATLQEYLVWYRRKPNDAERWSNWDRGARQKELLATWRLRYPELWRFGFPRIQPSRTIESEVDVYGLPAENLLATSDKRRLLLIVPWTAVGGADKFNLDLVEQLGRRGWEVTIVTTLNGDHSWHPRFTRLTPDVFALSHFLKPEDYPRFMRYIVRSRQPDAVLVSHSLFAYQALPYLRAIVPEGVPILDYCHIELPDWLDGGYPRASVENRDHLDLQIASSYHLREWMVREGADRERLEVCYTGVEPRGAEDSPSRADLNLPEDVPIVLYPCRVTDQKQPAVFAKTLQQLRERGYRFLALVVGDGDELPWLKGFVRRSGLSQSVRFLGVLSNARVNDLIAVSDCLFLPSKQEGISLALYEALTAGVPVVAANVGGQSELVTPECGFLVEPGGQREQVRRYADALASLLDDPDRRRRMGSAGRERVEQHFQLDEMGDRMATLIGRASELAVSDPRSMPTPQAARRAALAAVRNVVWEPPGSPLPLRKRGNWRWTALRWTTAVGSPIYRFALRREWHWLVPVKKRLIGLIVPGHPESR